MPKARKVYIVSHVYFDYNDKIYTPNGYEVDYVFSNKKAATLYQQEQNRQFLLSIDDFDEYCHKIDDLFYCVSDISDLLEYDRGTPYRTKSQLTIQDVNRIIRLMSFEPCSLAEAELMTGQP